MAIPASGPISSSMLNVELGRSSTTLITLASASRGSYAVINRNSSAGLAIYNNAISPGNNFLISQFYNLDQGANILFDFNFTNNASSDINNISIDLGTGNNVAYVDPLSSGGSNASNSNIDTTVSGDGLFVYFSNVPVSAGTLVDILLYDVDTGTTLYSVSGVNAKNTGNGSSIGPASNYYRHLGLTLNYLDP
jgi:hypothetical protein